MCLSPKQTKLRHKCRRGCIANKKSCSLYTYSWQIFRRADACIEIISDRSFRPSLYARIRKRWVDVATTICASRLRKLDMESQRWSSVAVLDLSSIMYIGILLKLPLKITVILIISLRYKTPKCKKSLNINIRNCNTSSLKFETLFIINIWAGCRSARYHSSVGHASKGSTVRSRKWNHKRRLLSKF